jgi:hypothetical protein
MTQSTAALDAAKKNLSDLDAQIKSLQDSINSEAPEEVMGVVEAQSRAQLSALQQQREIAAKNLEDLQQSNTDALAALTTAITNIPTDIAIKVNLDYGGGAAPTAQHFAGGGFVSTPRTAVVGDSAEYITPRTSISMLASEIVRAGNVASGGGMATYVQPSATAAHVEQQIVVKVGDAVIARAAVSGMPRQFTLQGV